MAAQNRELEFRLGSATAKGLRVILTTLCSKHPKFQQQLLQGFADDEKDKQRRELLKGTLCLRRKVLLVTVPLEYE